MACKWWWRGGGTQPLHLRFAQHRGLKSIGEDGPVHFRAYERPVEITWRFEHEDPREVVSMQVNNGEMLVQPIAPTVGRCSVRRVCGPLPRRVAQN